MKLKNYIMIISAVIGILPVAAAEQNCIEINAPLLKLFDGVIDLAPIIITVNKLHHIQSGQGPEKKGLINYSNQKVAIKQLLAVNAQDEMAKQALKQTIDMIKEINKKYSSDLTKYKSSIVGILKTWASQRTMNNSIMLRWSSVSDDVFFKQQLNSFQSIDQFIDEFTLFVRDVKCTCKKSSQIFDEILQKMKLMGAKKEL